MNRVIFQVKTGEGAMQPNLDMPRTDAAQTHVRFQMPILTTKLAMPSARPNMVVRPRLTARLAKSGQHRLTVVIAPAGWGKSSLVSQWCRQTEEARRVAWVSLDTGDNDPIRFLLYLIAALNAVAPGVGEGASNLLQTPQNPSLDSALTILLNDLHALEQTVTLVLDDYHAIEAQAVHDALIFLVEHLPPTLRLVIATRVDPPLPLSRLRVRGQLVELRAADLRFIREEIEAFLNQVMGLTLSGDDCARLEARTEGWIAGLQLAALSLQSAADSSAFLDSFTGSNRYIIDYLLEEVLAHQPETVQTFLLQTSLLDRFCGPLCEAVTEQTGGQAQLERLEAANLFLIPLDEERRWYRYHHLFADALRARLDRQAVNVAELHRRAADWLERNDLSHEAVTHALRGQHWEMAADLIEKHGDEAWRRGEQHTLGQWLQALPEATLHSRPVLLVFQARAYLYHLNLDAAEPLIQKLTETLDTRKGQAIQGRVCTLQAHLARLRGQSEGSLQFALRALEFLPAEEAFWRAATHLSLGAHHYHSGSIEAAETEFRACLEDAITAGDTHMALLSLYACGVIREHQGECEAAVVQYQCALDYANALRIPQAVATALSYAGLGRIAYERNDLTTARLMAEATLEQRNHVYVIPGYVLLVQLNQVAGNQKALLAALNDLMELARRSGLASFQSLADATHILFHPDRGNRMAAWLATYPGKIITMPAPLLTHEEDVFIELTQARLLLAQGKAEEVSSRLESLLARFLKQGRHGSAVEVRALLAVAYQRLGSLDRALAILQPALELAAKEGYFRVFLEAVQGIVPVLRHAVAKGIALEHINGLLQAFGSASSTQTTSGETFASVAMLSERELEVLRLVAAGLSNPQIAEQLFLSVGTVKRHVYNIYGKLEVTGRVEAITRARELKLL
jgi:LuxR family transcriptional regulator, maltose regulon positive regulatory protein